MNSNDFVAVGGARLLIGRSAVASDRIAQIREACRQCALTLPIADDLPLNTLEILDLLIVKTVESDLSGCTDDKES